MNILLINHYAGSPKHGMVYRPFYLAREWVKLGHAVTIVAASHSHLRQVAPAVRGRVSNEDVDGVRYVWLKTSHYVHNGIRRVLNILSFIWQLRRFQKKLIRDVAPEVVITSSTYTFDNYPARRVAKTCGAKLIYEVRDLWPLTPMELGGMHRWHPFIVMLQAAEDFAYRNADRVVSVLPNADGHMQQHGMARHKFVHIPNGVDVAEWQAGTESVPQEHAQALATLRRNGRFVVGYAGKHGLSNALDALVEAGQLLKTQPVTFVLVGQGAEKERLKRKARELDLADVVFLPPVPRGSLPALLASMDALYVGFARRPMYRFGVSPNKLLDYMIAAKPVICGIEAGNDLVAESRCGISIPPEDRNAIAWAVRRLMACSPVERTAMGERGRDYVTSHHDYTVLARRFLQVMA